jgi:hypothetical protein
MTHNISISIQNCIEQKGEIQRRGLWYGKSFINTDTHRRLCKKTALNSTYSIQYVPQNSPQIASRK